MNIIEETLAVGLIADHARTAGWGSGRCAVCDWPIQPGNRIADLADGSGLIHVRCAAKAPRTALPLEPAPFPPAGTVSPASGTAGPPEDRFAARSRRARAADRARHAAARI